MKDDLIVYVKAVRVFFYVNSPVHVRDWVAKRFCYEQCRLGVSLKKQQQNDNNISSLLPAETQVGDVIVLEVM